jgi:NAD(P)-dependent dehydrogenase (short-subunit alcohol dehydrogenase family)
VIVQGIGPGLGVKLAIEAARQGAKGLTICARTPEKLDDAERRIRALDVNCRVLKVPTDITDVAQCQRLADATTKEFGRIDALVSSGFMFGGFKPLSETTFADWLPIVHTNLVGTMQVAQAVIPQMKKQGGGAIVHVNTESSMKTNLGEAGYGASKAALTAATRQLAREVGPSQIRVNTARMGWMWGAPVQGALEYMAKSSGTTVEALKKEAEKDIALNRMMTDDECAKAVLFLVSDYAVAVTGATLDINGGDYMP